MSEELLVKHNFVYCHAAGIYSLMPRGLRSIVKLKQLCRAEMVKIGCLEVELASLLPAKLLKPSRIKIFGNSFFATNNYFLAPTHEEVVAQIFKSQVQSYKQLPLHYLQFSKKFRNELRPKAGLIRCREFIMQDSYSLHASKSCLRRSLEAHSR